MYKRNQVSDVLVKAIQSSHSRLDDRAILTRLKRLLDYDRKGKVPVDLSSLPQFAFFDAEAAGSGRDVTFSAYSVLALLVALRLMSCGLPQGRAVDSLRRFREALEREHRRMSAIDLASLLEANGTVVASSNAVLREQLIAKGNVVESLEHMVFFCVHADLEAVGELKRTVMDQDGPRPDNICRGRKELERRIALDAYGQSPTLVVELMNPFIQLNHLLSKTEPARRGRRRGT